MKKGISKKGASKKTPFEVCFFSVAYRARDGPTRASFVLGIFSGIDITQQIEHCALRSGTRMRRRTENGCAAVHPLPAMSPSATACEPATASAARCNPSALSGIPNLCNVDPWFHASTAKHAKSSIHEWTFVLANCRTPFLQGFRTSDHCTGLQKQEEEEKKVLAEFEESFGVDGPAMPQPTTSRRFGAPPST